MVEYSIAVCNYNMVDTIERSLRSILDQIDDRFEVVVVDGGSDDGSLAVLSDLSDEYGRLRVVELAPDPDRKLGADRNRSFQEADGEYVFESLDTDDVYLDGVIPDFAEIYRQIDEGVDFDFYLAGKGINLAPRDLLLDIPYRNLDGAEDRDLARRLFAADAVLWLEHEEVRTEVGYHFDWRDSVRRDLKGKTCDFQCGLSFWSCVRWALSHEAYGIFTEPRPFPWRVLKAGYDLATFPYAYLKARGRERYETPPAFRRKGALEEVISRERMTLSEIEAAYDVSVDRDALSETGREKFDV